MTALNDPKTPAEKATRFELQKSKLRADLAVALNLFDIAQSYKRDDRSSAVLQERGRKVNAAIAALTKVQSNDDSNREVWQARALARTL